MTSPWRSILSEAPRLKKAPELIPLPISWALHGKAGLQHKENGLLLFKPERQTHFREVLHKGQLGVITPGGWTSEPFSDTMNTTDPFCPEKSAPSLKNESYRAINEYWSTNSWPRETGQSLLPHVERRETRMSENLPKQRDSKIPLGKDKI